MGGLGVSFLVRRARSSWLLLACVTVTVALATGIAAAGWTFAAEAVPAGAMNSLAAPQGRVIALSGLADAAKAASDARVIRATLRQAWPGIGFQMDGALWTDPIVLPAPTTGPTSCPTVNSPRPGPQVCSASTTSQQVEVASLDGITGQARLAAGHWPAAPRRGDPVPVALPAAVASQLHLTVGSVLTGTSQSAGAVSLRVTGLFEPTSPGSPYWAVDLLPTSGVSVHNNFVSYAGIGSPGSVVSYGPAVVSPAAFGGTLTATQASWMVLPQPRPLVAGNIAALATSTSQAASSLAVSILPYGLTVTSGLPRLLTGIAATIVLTRSLFAIAALQLLLVAGVGLVLAARLLASLREEESAVLRARGATRWQLARPALAEAVVLGAVASAAGVLIGTRLAGPIARLSSLRLDSYPATGITTAAWLSALATLVVCVAVMTWPALQALTPAAARLRRGRQARLAGIAHAGGDLALLALAAVALWELRGYSAVAHPATGSLGIDPVVAVAPALALAGMAVIPLRGLPLLARLADKATDYERRLAAAMVSWQIARRPIRQAGPALLVVVVTATATLALAGSASWRQSAADQAAFAVGSDVRADSATGLPLGSAEAIARAPGVTAATAGSLATIGNGGQLIALDASTAGQTILLRPDLSPLPLTALWQRITPRQPSGVALPGRPGRLEITAALGGASPTSPAELRRALGGPFVLTAWIQEADGAAYPLAAGPLPIDGKPHALVFSLPGAGQASYPLRLLGLSLTYVLPPYDNKSPQSAPTAALTIASLAVAGAASGPFDPPFCRGACLARWQATGASPYVPTGPPGPLGTTPPSGGAAPGIQRWQPAAGGQRLTFNVGHDPSLTVELGINLPPGTATGTVAIAARPQSPVVPAIATSSYLAANRLGVGSTIAVPLSGVQVQLNIVASVADFPTVRGRGGALIADLTDVNDQLATGAASQYTLPLAADRWWLRTVGGRPPPLPASLGLSVSDRASQQGALLSNALLTAPRQAMLAVGVAAVLLGMLGFSISVAASLRSRRTQRAVFAALGVGKAAQAAQLCLEQCAVSLPAAAAGLLAGIGLAQLLVPAITLTTDAAQPVPWALVVVPLGLAVALALLTAAVPAAAAALSVLRSPDPAAQLRAEAR